MCSQASLHIEECENKVEGVGQQELSMQGVCLCVVTLKVLCCNWLGIYVDVISAVGRNLRI